MTYYRSGEWNFTCDLCGKRDKSSRARKTWTGAMVCESHREVRNPQDFLRGIRDDPSVPWSRTELWPQYGQCTVEGRSAAPGRALPGCSIPSDAYPPAPPPAENPICTMLGSSSIPSLAIPGCFIPARLPS